jgi:hypothetical protein
MRILGWSHLRDLFTKKLLLAACQFAVRGTPVGVAGHRASFKEARQLLSARQRGDITGKAGIRDRVNPVPLYAASSDLLLCL